MLINPTGPFPLTVHLQLANSTVLFYGAGESLYVLTIYYTT